MIVRVKTKHDLYTHRSEVVGWTKGSTEERFTRSSTQECQFVAGVLQLVAAGIKGIRGIALVVKSGKYSSAAAV